MWNWWRADLFRYIRVVTQHIPQLMQFGYEDSPFERDARAHELTRR